MDAAHRIPWHPVVLAAAYVGLFWVDAVVSPFAGTRSLIITVTSVLAIQLGLTALLRDARRAGLLTSTLLGVLWSKTVVTAAVTAAGSMGTALAVVWVGLIVTVAALIVRIARRRRWRWSVPQATYGLNVLSGLFLALTLVSAVTQGRIGMILHDLDQGQPWQPEAQGQRAPADPSSALPDIYVLLLDGYPRADTLERVFGYDNTPFLEALRSRGFETPSATRSDYLWTHLTLLSMFHRDFLERVDALGPLKEGGVPIHPAVRHAINDNPTFDDLRDAGYVIHSSVLPIEHYALRGTDVLLADGHLNEFEVTLLASTFAGDLLDALWPSFAAEDHRQRILDELDAVRRLAVEESTSPRFVMAHLLTPHHPAVWGADGSEVNPALVDAFYGDTLAEHDVSRAEFTDRYTEQLQHVNGLLIETIDALLESSTPPVVIVMSDHGSGVGIDPDNAEAGDLAERTSNLFAAFTPAREAIFPDDITPVNVMRLLLDAYLETNFGEVQPYPGGLHVEDHELAR